MKGPRPVIGQLNYLLAAKLARINQFFLHARMLENWGMGKIGETIFHFSVHEMKDTDKITKRLLFLEGLPNLQKIDPLKIGQNIEEILKLDLHSTSEIIPDSKKAISICEHEKDYITRDMLQEILHHE